MEVLPRAAELTVDGVALGPGARVVRVPDPRRWYRFRAAFPGFEAAELVEEGAHLAGARIALVLAPAGLEHARPLDLEDGESLALAAEALERRGDHETAVEFAERAAQAAPGAPTVLRVLRDVRGSADRGIEVRNRPQGGTEP